MFFGNQVTCDYWDYVWLNEGFASYLEYVIADKVNNKSLRVDCLRNLIGRENNFWKLFTAFTTLAHIGLFCGESYAQCDAQGCETEHTFNDTTHQHTR